MAVAAGSSLYGFETPLTNRYLQSNPSSEVRNATLNSLLRSIMEQRRSLTISHRKLVTEKRRSTRGRGQSIDARMSCGDRKTQLLDATVSSDNSEQRASFQRNHTDATTCIHPNFDEEPPRKPPAVFVPVPVHDLNEQSGLQETQVDYRRLTSCLRPKSEMRTASDRRTSTERRSVPQSPDGDSRLKMRPKSAWSRVKATFRTSLCYIPALSPTPAMRISPQLQRKLREDRRREATKRRKAVELHEKVAEFRRKQGTGEKQPASIFDVADILHRNSPYRPRRK